VAEGQADSYEALIFSSCSVLSASIPFAMPVDPASLRLATPDEIANTLSFALRFDGRERVHQGDEMMARIVADRLIKHLELSGFVVMKKPPVPMHSASFQHGQPGDV